MLNYLISSQLLFTSSLFFIYLWKKKKLISAESMLKVTRVFLLASLTLPLFFQFIPQDDYKITPIETWKSHKEKNELTQVSILTYPSQIQKKNPSSSIPLSPDVIGASFLLLLFFGFLITTFQFIKDQRKIHKIISQSLLFRQVGSLKVIFSNQDHSPMAYRGLKWRYIIIPQSILSDTQAYKLAVFHELQHHRQKDTDYCYFMAFIKAFFYWSPTYRLLEKERESERG